MGSAVITLTVQTYDWTNWSWWKGTLKLVHARNPWNGQNWVLNVTNGIYYQEITVGTVVEDSNCSLGWTNYHVHQSFWPAACPWTKNDGLGISNRNWEKPNPDHWIQKFSHYYAHPC